MPIRVAITGALAVVLALAVPLEAKTLRWSNNGDVTSMDPYAYYTTVNSSFLQNVYEPLVRYDRALKFEPSLATSWEVREPTVWRFHLRRGVRFHNGNAFTADDVVASLLRASHPNSPYQAATSAIKDVRKVDDHTVDVILKGSYPVLLNDLSGVLIMDREWMEQHKTLQPVNPAKGEESYATTNANGTGPFMLKSRRPDAETVLVVNPHWWDKRDHNIDEVLYRPIRSDATRVAALLSGEMDLITPAPLQDLDRLRRETGLEVLVGQDLRVIMLGMSQGPTPLKASNVKDKNPLADVRVRKALHQATDKDTLARRVMRGLAKPTAIIVAPEIQGYDPALADVIAPHDPDAARKLLAEAGYPQGFEVGLDCPNDQYVNIEQICQAVAAMWARIGVKVNLTVQTSALHTKKMLSGGADVYLFGWANTPQLDAFAVLNNAVRTGGRYNPGGYSNPKADELIARIATELDRPTRQKLMTEAFLVQKRDFALLPLHQEPLTWAARKGVQVVQVPDNKVRLWWFRLP